MTDGEGPLTLVFIGHANPASAARAAEFEDRVLALLPEHGAKIVYRGRRGLDADPSLPFEVHLLWFPSRGAFDAYLANSERMALMREYGEVFDRKHVYELDTVTFPGGGESPPRV